MSVLLYTLLAVTGVSALSLLGLLALSADEARIRESVSVLASLAAGATIGGAVFELLPDARARHASALLLIVGVAIGVAGFWAIEQALHRTAARHPGGKHGPGTHPIVALNAVGDVLHNGVDGVIIAAAFLAQPTAGLITTLAIVLHEIPRELGSFGVFMHGGLSVRRAVLYNALTGVTAIVGALATLLIGARIVAATTVLLPIAAGTFLYIGGSIIGGGVFSGPSVTRAQRIQRLALAALACAGTAVAARIG